MNLRNIAPYMAAAIFAVAAAIAMPATAPAQTSGSTGEASPPKTDWSEQKLESFASAAVALSSETSKWRQRIAEADSEAEAQKLQKKANEAVVETVQSEGLSMAEYREIYAATQGSPQLNKRIMQLIKEEQRN